MGKKCKNSKDKRRAKRVNTKNIINKLIQPHTGVRRNIRKEKKRKKTNVDPIPVEKREHLKFGSININGIDLQKHSAVHQLINARGFDVGILINKINKKFI